MFNMTSYNETMGLLTQTIKFVMNEWIEAAHRTYILPFKDTFRMSCQKATHISDHNY